MNIWMILAVGAAGYFVYRWYQTLEPAVQRDFTDELVHDCAVWLAPRVQLSPAEANAALHALLARGELSPELEALRRIEYEVVRETAERALRNVFITLGAGADVQTGQVHRRMAWSSLPEKVRDRFIVGGDRASFVLYDRTQLHPDEPL